MLGVPLEEAWANLIKSPEYQDMKDTDGTPLENKVARHGRILILSNLMNAYHEVGTLMFMAEVQELPANKKAIDEAIKESTKLIRSYGIDLNDILKKGK